MTDNTTHMNNENYPPEVPAELRYHSPRLVNLGDIHSLILAGNCGIGDLGNACGVAS